MARKWSQSDEKGLAFFVPPELPACFFLPDRVNRTELLQWKQYRQLAEEIYNALIAKNIKYALEPENNESNVQLIRTPEEILEIRKEGTCLDLAVLYCGLCLSFGLLPLLIVLRKHALVAVSLHYSRQEYWEAATPEREQERSLFQKEPLKDVEFLRNLLRKGRFMAIECTGFAHTETALSESQPEGVERQKDGTLTFERAIAAGEEQLYLRDRPLAFALDIAIAHQHWKIKQDVVYPNPRLPLTPTVAGIRPEEIPSNLPRSGVVQIESVDTVTARLNEYLERQIKLSRARCINLWRAAGVCQSEAIQLADDFSVGVPCIEIQPTAENPLQVLIGEFGSGKSLLTERLFQRALAQALENPDVPIPVYLRAGEVIGQLREVVEKAVHELGASLSKGAAVIIDGADEAGSSLAIQLLSEARILVNTWSEVTVVISSRPLPSLDIENLVESGEAVFIPPLSDEHAYTLVKRISRQDIALPYAALKYPQPILEAIHRPLFAVLLGRYLKDRDTAVPNSAGELLIHLVQKSLQQTTIDYKSYQSDKIGELLRNLAVLCTKSNTGCVHKTEVGLSSHLQILLDTRLVVEENENIRFPLPILTQWFASQSLAYGSVSFNDFIDNIQQLERWRYALAILISSSNHEIVSPVITPVVRQHPAFAAEIIKEELARRIWRLSDTIALPPEHECGQRVQFAMKTWVQGIAPLSQLIAPVHGDNTVLPLGIDLKEDWLTTAWYCGEDNLENIVKLPQIPTFEALEEFRRNWRNHQFAKPVHKSAWAWEWTLSILVSSLSNFLKNRLLPVDDGILSHEAVWQTALSITGRSSFDHRPISLDELEEYLANGIQLGSFRSHVTERMRQNYIAQLRTEINYLRQSGEINLQSPFVGSDREIEEGYVWQEYSLERMRIRVASVYSSALDAYQQIVRTWFPQFASRLKMSVLLPARLVGVISFPNFPWLNWHLEALPYDQESSV